MKKVKFVIVTFTVLVTQVFAILIPPPPGVNYLEPTLPSTQNWSHPNLGGVTRPNEDFDPSSRAFERAIRKGKAFVDKTLLLKEIIEDENKRIFITCPRDFGKSVIHDMIARFFEIIYHPDRKRFANVTRTKNYHIYKNEFLNLSISKDEKFFEQHFAQHPVVYLNIGNCGGLDAWGVNAIFKLTLTHAFLHFDFVSSVLFRKLKNDEKAAEELMLFRKISENGFDNEDIDIVMKVFIKYVSMFYKKKIIILVDGFNEATLFMIRRGFVEDIKNIIDSMNALMLSFDQSDQYIERIIMTSTSEMVRASATFGMNGFKHYRFLDNHRYAKYFGFTKDEVEVLFEKHSISADRRRKFYHFYDGYVIKNTDISIFNPLDTIRFMKSNGTIDNYWIKAAAKDYNSVLDVSREWFGLSRYLKHQSLAANISLLLANKKIHFDLAENLTLMEVELFGVMINGTTRRKSLARLPFRADFYLTYLFEQGYLSYVKHEDAFKIPNREIELVIENEVMIHTGNTSWMLTINDDTPSTKSI